MASFSLSVKLEARPLRLCWKYLIVSRNWTWFPMLAKFMSVGFFPPMVISVVCQHQILNLAVKKKEIKPKQVMCYHWYFEIIFPYFFVADFYFPSYMRVMYAVSIFHYSFNILMNFWDRGILFTLLVLQKCTILEYKNVSNFPENSDFLEANLFLGIEILSISSIKSYNEE